MRHKTQTRWALVAAGGFINTGHMAFARREVIRALVEQRRGFRAFAAWAGLSDAQFWRKLKRRHGWTVRRVNMKVAR